ncbi:MAG: MarR family winged helix-turn-helix transcriptional regulator [Coriobacteriia bacterium]
MDAPIEDVGYLLHRASRHFRVRLARALADLQLTPQQASVLIALATAPTGVRTHKEIAEGVDADLATTTGLLSRLERDGWLASAKNPRDGRSRTYSLTPKANDLMPDVLARAAGASAEASASLTPPEIATLTRLLIRLGR